MYEINHNLDRTRFQYEAHGKLAKLIYETIDEAIVFVHTEVPDEFEGQGIGSALVQDGLAYARQHDLMVIPWCPFVRRYIEEHPEWQDLLPNDDDGVDQKEIEKGVTRD